MSKQSSVQFVTISDDESGQRIDNYLITFLKGIPKTRIYKMLRKGEVRVNKGRIKPVYRLSEGDVVRIPPVHIAENDSAIAEPGSRQKELLVSSIIHEDDDLMVLNKPAGIAVHGGSGLKFGVIEVLRSLKSEHQYLELVHRLDRETSGCLIVAKNRKTLRWLHECLREDRVNKVYHALVYGKWPKHLFQVDAPLRKNELKSGERIVKVDIEGKPSRTEVKVLNSVDGYTLVQAKPITGRTHQIRVHCLHSGHAIVGDEKYAPNDLQDRFRDQYGKPRLMLHAARIEFPARGSAKKLRFEADYDERFRACLGSVGIEEEKIYAQR